MVLKLLTIAYMQNYIYHTIMDWLFLVRGAHCVLIVISRHILQWAESIASKRLKIMDHDRLTASAESIMICFLSAAVFDNSSSILAHEPVHVPLTTLNGHPSAETVFASFSG